MIEWLEKILGRLNQHAGLTERNIANIMATQADLAAAIAALPDKITAEVLVPIQAEIGKLTTGGGSVPVTLDTQPTIDSLSAIPALVASAVAASFVTPVTTPPVTPSPTSVTNEDGSVTTTTYNADGSVATVTAVDASGFTIPNP